MNIRNPNNIAPVTSEHGEIIYEMFGTAPGAARRTASRRS